MKKELTSQNEGEEILVNQNGKRPNEASDVGKKRIKSKSLYRQPTASELSRLQETENLFNSNLFRLQVDEVLQEVKVKEKTLIKFHTWFEDFKKYLNTISENDSEFDLSEQVLFKELKVKLPVGRELKKIKCSFRFHKFTHVNIVGSFDLGCAINSKLRVDIQIVVPADTYTKNDSVNYRYHKKRAAYLACIASHLKNCDLVTDLKYSWSNGCEYKPVLDLKPNNKLGNHLCVRINLVTDAQAYKFHRYSPSRNNLRQNWLLTSENIGNTNSGASVPTPYYNSSVLGDVTNSINNNYLKEILGTGENLKQAIILLKIWLRQRNLSVSGHVVSMLVAYLVQIKRINNIMSSYQIVRNVWIFLKTSDWDTKGISMYKGDNPTPSLDEFSKYFPVVFLDRTGYYNICWQMLSGTYNALRKESSIAVQMLDNSSINSFVPLFMTPFAPMLQFDHIMRFKNTSKVIEAVYAAATMEDKLNYGVDKLALVIQNLNALLTKGLGPKVHLVLQQVEADFSWSVKKKIDKLKSSDYEEKLFFGFILDAQNCLNTVDKGPPANLPEAEAFRAFWGEKSELRRFQDGSITETCVWEADSLAQRRLLVRQVCSHLLTLKYGINDDEVFYVADQLDSVLICKAFAPPDGVVGTGEESTLRVLQAFDELRKDLRTLSELPLDINSVYGVSPVFSYSDPFPPLAQGLSDPNPWKRAGTCLIKDSQEKRIKCPPYISVSKVVMELGHSGKWPGDLEAFRCLKAAFKLQIAAQLRKQYSLTTQVYPTHMDVLKSGLVFRLEIAHAKEVTLLRRQVENDVVKYRDSDESVELHCRTAMLPRLRGAMHGLHQKHPAYGPTASLLKRWLSAHLLDDWHFPDAVAELLSASVFLSPEPLAPPAQPLCAFLRVLRILASADWGSDIVIVNFNDDLKREEIAKLEAAFNEKAEGTPAMFIATPYDGDTPSAWSRRGPSRNVLARVRALASSTMRFIEHSLLDDMKDNILGTFIPSLSGFDVLIQVHQHLVKHEAQRVERPPLFLPLPPPEPSDNDVIPVVEFDPLAKYLAELRSAYGEFALFFHDTYGGDIIAVLWKPHIGEIKDFQVSHAAALKPVEVNGETKYKVNVEALIEDFKILGEGLVKNVTVQS